MTELTTDQIEKIEEIAFSYKDERYLIVNQITTSALSEDATKGISAEKKLSNFIDTLSLEEIPLAQAELSKHFSYNDKFKKIADEQFEKRTTDLKNITPKSDIFTSTLSSLGSLVSTGIKYGTSMVSSLLSHSRNNDNTPQK
jgi:hypothetical protein